MKRLTRTQLDALAHLHRVGYQYPTGNARWHVRRDGRGARYAARTLRALVDAGLARWDHPAPDELARVVPTTRVDHFEPGARITLPREHGADVARAILTGALWRRYPQAYIDGDRVTRVQMGRVIDGIRTWQEA